MTKTLLILFCLFLCGEIIKADFPICTDSAGQVNPAISGDIVVWCDARNGNVDIFGYNLITSTEFPICTDSLLEQQVAPAISGDIVVWYDESNGNWDIYGTAICMNKPQSDANNDCKTDMLDFAIMASEWMDCGYNYHPRFCWE